MRLFHLRSNIEHVTVPSHAPHIATRLFGKNVHPKYSRDRIVRGELETRSLGRTQRYFRQRRTITVGHTGTERACAPSGRHERRTKLLCTKSS